MKAIYQNPTVEYITMSLEEMIAASKGILGQDDPGIIDLGDINETTATSGNLSRRYVWDDEDFDDEF